LDCNTQSENHGYKIQQTHLKTFTDSSDPTIEFLETKNIFSILKNPKLRYFQNRFFKDTRQLLQDVIKNKK